MKLFGSLTEIVSLIFRKNNQAITLRPNQATTYTASRDIQTPPQDAASVLVSENATQSLSNKTMGSTNTLTGATAASFTNSGAVSLPSGVDTLVGRASADQGANRLQNKDLDDGSVAVVDSSDTSKKIRFDAGGTTSTATTITGAQTANRTITLPDASTTLVGTGATQTLQNKTLDNTNSATLLDTNLTLQDNGDNSKQARFNLSGITTATTRTFDLPDTSSSILTRTSVDQLTNRVGNKDLTADSTRLVDNSDTSKRMNFSTSGSSAATTTTIATVSTADRTITLPDAATTLVGTGVTQTLSNKTFSDAPLLKAGISIEDPGAGTNKVLLTAPTLAGDYTLTVPTTGGSSGQFLQTNGSGTTTWATPTGAQDSADDRMNFTLTASVAANALTIALKNKAGSDPSGGDAVNLAFRSGTTTAASYSLVSATAATSVVVPSGTTLGHTNGNTRNIYVYAINNAGTVELAVSSLPFNEFQLLNTTAISGGNSLTTIYSTTARTGVAIRYLGQFQSTQTTAGTWATAMSFGSLSPIQGTPGTVAPQESSAMGTKQYIAGTSYQNGTPAVTSDSGLAGFSQTTNARTVLVPYQMMDGTWRMRFNVVVAFNSATVTDETFSISGVSFKTISGAGSNPPISAGNSQGSLIKTAFVENNGDGVRAILNASTASVTAFSFSGDVELNSKPTWAD